MDTILDYLRTILFFLLALTSNLPSLCEAGEERTLFGAHIDAVAVRAAPQYPAACDEKAGAEEISLAARLGADFVRMDVNEEMLSGPESRQSLMRLCNRARGLGLRICITARGDDRLKRYPAFPGGGTGTWETFERMYHKQLQAVILDFSPDSLVIFPDCMTQMASQISLRFPNHEWLQMIKTVVKPIRKEHPGIKLILSQKLDLARPDAMDLVKRLAENRGLVDYLGLSIASYDDLNQQMILAAPYAARLPLWWVEVNNANHYRDDLYQRNFFLQALNSAIEKRVGAFCVSPVRDDPPSVTWGITDVNLNPKTTYEQLRYFFTNYRHSTRPDQE
ncbi:MAG: hypothetical protein HYU64_17155 [Armatimonadetes bacterium]|nr:hypothetical protein [Armatimonadota bacterium]